MIYWNDEEKAALKVLVATGISGGEIAKILSAQFGRPISRSAIGGAANRLGLKLVYRQPKGEKKAKPPLKGDSNQIRRLKGLLRDPGIVGQVQEPVDESAHCTIWELTRWKCHFPLWPDQYRANPSLLYCGAKAKGSPYCGYHNRVVYRQPNREPAPSLTMVKVP